MPDLLSPETVQASLRGRFGSPHRHHPSIGSTNSEAMRWASDDGASEGSLVTTDHQTAGRGRRGRSWFDEPGTSLLFSLILRPRITFERLGLLPIALGTAVAAAVTELVGTEAKTKWPNDVTIDDRKVAGMLVETKLVGPNVDIAICGVGVNRDWSQVDVPVGLRDTAVSLSDLNDEVPARSELLAEILVRFEELYPWVIDGSKTSDLLDRARTSSSVLGRRIGIRTAEGSMISGRALDIAEDGGLTVDVEGEVRTFNVGEIEHLRPASS